MDEEQQAIEKVGEAIEAVKSAMAAVKRMPGMDARSLAVSKTQFETAFMWLGAAAQGEGVLDD